MTARAAAALLLMLPAWAAQGRVAESADADWTDYRVRRGTFTLVSENDKYFAGSDRHYTNGLKLTWLNETNLDESPRFTQRVAKLMPWLRNARGNGAFDTIAHGRVTAGNVQTHLAGGLTARAGWRLPADFGPDLIRPGGGNTPNATDTVPFTAYLFAHGELRAVARDIFLDGNTWRDSHSVRKRPLVADLSLGLVIGWPALQVTYTQAYRTKEFYGQAQRHVFGSIGLSWAY